MQRFVKKMVDLMREEKLFSWQGGPIIMLQVVTCKQILWFNWNIACILWPLQLIYQ